MPRVGDLASAETTHDYRDLYSVATLQNELGYAQVTKSVSGLSAIAFPPYACCGVPETPLSPGFLLTCEIFLNGNLLIACGGSARQVTYTWYPHRVVRKCQAEGLHFVTETCMPSKQRSVAQRITVRNLGRGRRKIQLVST
jgi:hypothetical protein